MGLKRIKLAMVMAALMGVQAFAAGNGSLSLIMTGHLVVTEMEDNKPVYKLQPLPEQVNPGDTIQYDINGENTSDKALMNVEANGRIPIGTVYIDGFTNCDVKADILFSADDGKSFSKPPIMIKVKQPDGKEIEQIASPDHYTTIRFVIQTLESRQRFTGTYRVKVK